MKDNGHIFFRDDFDTIYTIDWQTIGGTIDLTSVISQPFVWGKSPSGFVRDGIMFRRGVVTITRQVLKPFEGGYEIVAEGTSQYEDDVQMNFPCKTDQTDRFKYYLDRPFIDESEIVISDGPRWAAPDIDHDMLWGDVAPNGNPIVPETGVTTLEFVDVWA